jgi:hypothetical protein
MDREGTPVLWVLNEFARSPLYQLISVFQIRRPFAWINSRMYVQRLKDWHDYTPTGEPVLDTFAEAQQRWHLWRRRYDLFLRWGVRSPYSAPVELRLPIEPHRRPYYRMPVNLSLNQNQITLRSLPRSMRAFGHGTSRFAAPVAKRWRVSAAHSVALGVKFLPIRARFLPSHKNVNVAI